MAFIRKYSISGKIYLCNQFSLHLYTNFEKLQFTFDFVSKIQKSFILSECRIFFNTKVTELIFRGKYLTEVGQKSNKTLKIIRIEIFFRSILYFGKKKFWKM